MRLSRFLSHIEQFELWTPLRLRDVWFRWMRAPFGFGKIHC
jgi:hypothetical protein